MKIGKNLILIMYFFFILSFLLCITIFKPIPKVNKLSINIPKRKSFTSRIYPLNKKIDNKLSRRINIGNSYNVFVNKNVSFQITSIAFNVKSKFDLSNYSNNNPEFIIKVDDINTINGNNFGIKKSIIRNQYQTCLFFNKDPYFIYKIDDENIYKYNDYSHWFSILRREIQSLFTKNNSNCLLITTENSEIFENYSRNIYEIIKNNFIYEGN